MPEVLTEAEDTALDYDTRRLLAWRADSLLKLGFKIKPTLVLMHRPDIVHDATALIEAGCDPKTAAKILL